FRVGEKVNGKGLANAQDLPYSIGGRIVQSGDREQGIPGVAVTLLERALDAITDEQGRYVFSGVPEGLYTLVISAPDRGEQRVPVQVPGASYDVEL
ncbi:MAG: MSCRAMM family adhesin SdrC, partial [Chloroflexi bacterium]|nr:MSCRAMM family adhesin SdrC [Chloroflexota bacterium]